MQVSSDQPKITANGLVTFMRSTFYGREEVLRRFKYTYPGQKIYAPYYQTTNTTIREYHRKDNDPFVFNLAIEKLQEQLKTATRSQVCTRLQSNIRAINLYQKNFGDKQFKIVPQNRFPALHIAGVEITCNPDIQVNEADQLLLIILSYGINKPDSDTVAMLCQLVYAASQGTVNIAPSAVRLLDLSTGVEMRWSGRAEKRRRQIEAACRDIAAQWPLL